VVRPDRTDAASTASWARETSASGQVRTATCAATRWAEVVEPGACGGLGPLLVGGVEQVEGGASIRDLMAHMGHRTHNAALVYQHADVQRQQAMAAKLSDAIEQAIWPTSGPATANVNRKAKRQARSQRR